MNKNFNKIPKNVLDQVDNLIGDSGMSKEEFIKKFNYDLWHKFRS